MEDHIFNFKTIFVYLHRKRELISVVFVAFLSFCTLQYRWGVLHILHFNFNILSFTPKYRRLLEYRHVNPFKEFFWTMVLLLIDNKKLLHFFSYPFEISILSSFYFAIFHSFISVLRHITVIHALNGIIKNIHSLLNTLRINT